jgi:hypothetical protein
LLRILLQPFQALLNQQNSFTRLWWKKPFSALFIATVARFNSGVAILHIQPVQSLDAPELALYQAPDTQMKYGV